MECFPRGVSGLSGLPLCRIKVVATPAHSLNAFSPTGGLTVAGDSEFETSAGSAETSVKVARVGNVN